MCILTFNSPFFATHFNLDALHLFATGTQYLLTYASIASKIYPYCGQTFFSFWYLIFISSYGNLNNVLNNVIYMFEAHSIFTPKYLRCMMAMIDC